MGWKVDFEAGLAALLMVGATVAFLAAVLPDRSATEAQPSPAVTCSDEWLDEYRSRWRFHEYTWREKEIECRTLRALESIAESLRERSE